MKEEQQATDIGFVFETEYTHDEWFTRTLKKGVLTLAFTYKTDTKKLETLDVEIEESSYVPISIYNLSRLDAILNKSKNNRIPCHIKPPAPPKSRITGKCNQCHSKLRHKGVINYLFGDRKCRNKQCKTQ